MSWTQTPGKQPIGRRAFVAALAGAAGALLTPGASGQKNSPRDPRLTARPRPPRRTPEVGVTRIGPGLPRGGLLYVPESYSVDAPAPLIVALHGGGGYAGSWSRLYEACDARGVLLMAPDSRGRSWDRVVGDFGPDVAFIDSALRYTFERCTVDTTRIALAGFSDGASYALSLGPSNGDLFTHLIAWSPGFSDAAEPIVGEPEVFVSHGTQDNVLSIHGTRGAIVPMLEMDGYAVEYLEFEGRHEMPPEVRDRALDWFLG